jgi:hypothetical protein
VAALFFFKKRKAPAEKKNTLPYQTAIKNRSNPATRIQIPPAAQNLFFFPRREESKAFLRPIPEGD